jgi:hypothetical protein
MGPTPKGIDNGRNHPAKRNVVCTGGILPRQPRAFQVVDSVVKVNNQLPQRESAHRLRMHWAHATSVKATGSNRIDTEAV